MSYSVIAVIYNPNSTGSSEAIAKQFIEDVKKRLPEQKTLLIPTERAKHAEELAYTLATENERPLIVSSSGDGGYHEIVNGAMKAQNEGRAPTTAILPAGNANDHYRNLHDEDTIEAIASDNAMVIDLLKLTSTAKGETFVRYAHSYIGFGLTPVVGLELNKTKLNFFQEVRIIVTSLINFKSVRLKIDGKVRRYDSIIFGNVDKMSKVLKISEAADLTDGKFEVSIFRRRQKLQLIAVMIKASLFGIREDLRTERYELGTIRETLAQADGEILTVAANAHVVITAEKQTLRCIV